MTLPLNSIVCGKRIIRVFPRRTNATPVDSDVAVDRSPGFLDEADEVHISVLFTYDLAKVDKLAKEWKHVAQVKIGGPATGAPGGEFTPGLYVKHGYVITSRGCPNKCWFCSVWKREGGTVRELQIQNGFHILDDNLLACSEAHIRKVFDMLARQSEPAIFGGGLEAARLEDWHVDLLSGCRFAQAWFAYDTPDDWEPLVCAAKKLRQAGLTRTRSGSVSHKMRCYCLVGYPSDTHDAAQTRLQETYRLGFLPMAMLYRNNKGKTTHEWRRFQRAWARPAGINRMCREGTYPGVPVADARAGQLGLFAEGQ